MGGPGDIRAIRLAGTLRSPPLSFQSTQGVTAHIGDSWEHTSSSGLRGSARGRLHAHVRGEFQDGRAFSGSNFGNGAVNTAFRNEVHFESLLPSRGNQASDLSAFEAALRSPALDKIGSPPWTCRTLGLCSIAGQKNDVTPLFPRRVSQRPHPGTGRAGHYRAWHTKNR